ncbi:MAG: alpha-mannosidase [Armatimonadetes bacterium]|nr:alpha-mannosidase [Armatimonadota bacterium]
MHRLAALLAVCFALPASLCIAQQSVDRVLANLQAISVTDAGDWRFAHPAQPGGEAPDLDDSAWQVVRPEHGWEFPNTSAWYRKRVVIPQTVGGVSVEGSRLVLTCAVDDDMDLYVNGRNVGRFHWDQGRAVLTEDAQPGQEIVVAIRAINQGGPGRLLWARLDYEALESFREPAGEWAARLQFCKRLLDSKRMVDKRAEYLRTLDAAAGMIDFDAISRRDPKAFEASLDKCLAALTPFSQLAKQYTIFLVGHAHIDMNWLWLWPETKTVCRLTWDQALKFMDEYPEFRFTQSQPGAYIAIEEECPELFARIQEAVARGQWEPAGASWVEGDTNMASGEALARQCLLVHHYYTSRFGQQSRLVWLPDNFGHAWTVPSIFSDAGYEHFYFCRAGKGLPTFWWEGPDGGRLLAYNHRWYNEEFRRDRGVVPLEIEDRVGIPACMIVYGVGDHGGGPTRQDIEAAKALQADPLFPNIQFAATEDYFTAALEHSKGDLPIVKDELNFTFEGCYTTHSDVKRWNRDSENILPIAEALSAIAAKWGPEYPREGLTRAWRNTCFNQFHDILPGSAIHGSYEYSKELYEQTREVADSAIDQSLEALCAQIDTRGEGQAVVVWNPVAWDRKDRVAVVLRTPGPWPGAIVTDTEGKALPAQVINSKPDGEAFATTVEFIADLPALGYAVFHITSGPVREPWSDPSTQSITDEQVASMKAQGIPMNWEHRHSPDISARFLLEMLHEAPHGMSAWNIGPITKTETLELKDVRLESKGDVCTRFVASYAYGQSTFDVQVSMYESLQRVEFDMLADWRELGNARDGGPFLKAAFKTSVDSPRATFEIPWGSIERAADGHEVPAQKWIDLAQARRVVPEGGRDAKAIDVSRFFNEDVFAGTDDTNDGDFDNGNRSYPAEILPTGDARADGVPLIVPPVEKGALNSIRAEGQTIEWPAESAPALGVFGASSNGRHGGPATLLYEDGTRAPAVLEFSDWCFGPGSRETTAFRLDHRYADGRRAEPPVHIWLQRIPLDPSRPVKGIVLPKEPNLHLFGFAFTESVTYETNWGLALLNDCKYGFDVKGNVMRMSLLRASYDPDPMPDLGTHRIRFAIMPHQGDWRHGEVPRRALEFNQPPIARVVDSHPGTLPSAYSFVRVEPAEMILSAFKLAEDGNGFIARVYNSAGVGGTARITCNLPFSRAESCNLLEQSRETNSATVDGPVVSLDLQGRLHGTVRLVP